MHIHNFSFDIPCPPAIYYLYGRFSTSITYAVRTRTWPGPAQPGPAWTRSGLAYIWVHMGPMRIRGVIHGFP